jgi:hypothetical protein
MLLQEPSASVAERPATDHLLASRDTNDPSKTRPKVLLVDDDGDNIFLTRKCDKAGQQPPLPSH